MIGKSRSELNEIASGYISYKSGCKGLVFLKPDWWYGHRLFGISIVSCKSKRGNNGAEAPRLSKMYVFAL